MYNKAFKTKPLMFTLILGNEGYLYMHVKKPALRAKKLMTKNNNKLTIYRHCHNLLGIFIDWQGGTTRYLLKLEEAPKNAC